MITPPENLKFHRRIFAFEDRSGKYGLRGLRWFSDPKVFSPTIQVSLYCFLLILLQKNRWICMIGFMKTANDSAIVRIVLLYLVPLIFSITIRVVIHFINKELSNNSIKEMSVYNNPEVYSCGIYEL